MTKLQEKNNQFSITIPKSLVKQKGWKKGTEVAIGFNEHGDLIIKEIKK